MRRWLAKNTLGKILGSAQVFVLGVSPLCLAFSLTHQSDAASRASTPASNEPERLRSAKESFAAGDYAAAKTFLLAGLEKNPSSAEFHFWLGRCHYELLDFNASSAALERAVQLEAKNSLYRLWLGRADSERADREHSLSLARKVKKEFQAAVQLDPANVAAHRDLAEYEVDAPWIAGGDKDDARKQVQAIAAIDAIDGELARAMYVFHAEKKPEQAEEIYKKLLDLRPQRIEPYFEMARFFQYHGRPADLELAIEGAVAVDPNDLRLEYFRGVLQFLQKKDLLGAERRLDNYVSHTPQRSNWPWHTDAREWLGRTLEAEGKRTEAIEQYREALRLDPKRKIAREHLKELEKLAN